MYIYIGIFPRLALANVVFTVLYYGLAAAAQLPTAAAERSSLYKFIHNDTYPQTPLVKVNR